MTRSLKTMQQQIGGVLEPLWFSSANREIRLIIERRGPEEGPLYLLLPALSTISSRSEWKDFAQSLGNQYHIVSFDWPGFGDSERPKVNYNIEILKQALRAVLQHLEKFKPKQITLVAAGHSASVALALATESSENWTKLILVAPTWRGPLPTMTSWHPKHFGWLRGLVGLPILGPVLYHLNTSRAILKYMLRRHVWVQTNWLTNERLLELQKISRRTGSRFASAAFVTGGLDPAGDRTWWLRQIKKLQCTVHVVIAKQAPPRSKREMELLADLAQQISAINGRLGLHQEFGAMLSEQLISS